jgi:vitamin B12 transporter
MSLSRPSFWAALAAGPVVKSITLASLFAVAPSTFADDSSAAVEEEVIVTAFRLPTDLSKTGSSIFVLEQEQIKQRGFVYLTDALMSIPGVTINQNGAFGGQASARIRGASSDQTLVLLDGIVINDTSTPGGSFNFGTMDLSNVERMEVLKGPQSTLWGTDAIGGVINIVSKNPESELGGNFGIQAGSFGTMNMKGSVTAGNALGSFRLDLSDSNSVGLSKADEEDGNSEEDSFEATTVSASVNVNLPGDSLLQITHRESETETEFDSFGVATGVQDGDELSIVDRQTSQVRLTIPALSGRLSNTLVYGRTETERNNFTDGVAGFSADGESEIFQYQGTYQINDQQQISIGFEDESAEANSNDSDIQGIYALYQISPIDSVTVSMGVRQDDHSEFGEETVGRISAAWEVNSSLDLQASWGEGFKAPSIFQTTFFCCGATAPNANLVAETSESFDFGFIWRFNDNGVLAITYFDQDTENQIDFSFAVGGYENIAEVDSTGFEIAFDYAFSNTLSLRSNLAYIDSEDGNGNELVRIPEVTGDVALTWTAMPDFNTTLAVIYNDDEEDSRGTVDSWTRVDASGVWQISDNFEFTARLENLTDRDYQQIFGYGTPGRSGYIGFNYFF